MLLCLRNLQLIMLIQKMRSRQILLYLEGITSAGHQQKKLNQRTRSRQILLYLEGEEADYRSQVLADAAALKKLAVDYGHPEKEVKTDPAVFGRNYFNRASAGETESFEEADYRS
eukprot:227587_1